MKLLINLVNLAAAINWLGVAHVDDACSSTLLSQGQRRVCNHGFFGQQVLKIAAKHTLRSCRQQMSDQRWGCHLSRQNVLSREHAFTHALAAAQLLIATTRNCEKGDLSNCRPREYTKQIVGLATTRSKLEKDI